MEEGRVGAAGVERRPGAQSPGSCSPSRLEVEGRETGRPSPFRPRCASVRPASAGASTRTRVPASATVRESRTRLPPRAAPSAQVALPGAEASGPRKARAGS